MEITNSIYIIKIDLQVIQNQVNNLDRTPQTVAENLSLELKKVELQDKYEASKFKEFDIS